METDPRGGQDLAFQPLVDQRLVMAELAADFAHRGGVEQLDERRTLVVQQGVHDGLPLGQRRLLDLGPQFAQFLGQLRRQVASFQGRVRQQPFGFGLVAGFDGLGDPLQDHAATAGAEVQTAPGYGFRTIVKQFRVPQFHDAPLAFRFVGCNGDGAQLLQQR